MKRIADMHYCRHDNCDCFLNLGNHQYCIDTHITTGLGLQLAEDFEGKKVNEISSIWEVANYKITYNTILMHSNIY